MLHRYLLKKEHANLAQLEDKRARTWCIIKAEQAALKQETRRGLGTGEGLLISFVAGCAVSLTVKHSGKVLSLRRFPLSQVLSLVSLLAQLKGSE